MTTTPDTTGHNPAFRDALGPLKDREQVAERLLRASAGDSVDPDTELDWNAPFEEGKWFWPPDVTRIHVAEEARHVRYAREELRRQMARASRWHERKQPPVERLRDWLVDHVMALLVATTAGDQTAGAARSLFALEPAQRPAGALARALRPLLADTAQPPPPVPPRTSGPSGTVDACGAGRRGPAA